MSMRGAVERLTHPLVFRRRLPPPFPRLTFYASSEGGLRYLRPSLREVDPPLLGATQLCVRPGDVVWDIGANVGLFSVAAAALAGPSGRVVAIEADVWLVSLLRRTAQRRGARAPIEVISAAISDSLGLATFNIAQRSRSTSALSAFGTTQTGGTRSSQTVITVTLDWLLDHLPRPTIIKIDVEAAEVAVLRGAGKVLACHPTIIVEVAGENSHAVAEILTPLGYRFLDAGYPAHPECALPSYLTVAVSSPPALPTAAAADQSQKVTLSAAATGSAKG